MIKEQEIKKLEKLVEKVKQKDEAAFAELYQATYNKVYFFALSLVKEQHLAEDVVQEVFLVVFRSISDLKDNRLFVAWVNQITYRVSLSIIKKNAEIPFVSEDIEREMKHLQEEDVISKILKKKRDEELVKLIFNLPVTLKTVVVMRYYNDCSLDDIATVMSCPVGTVKSRLNTAKRKLREDLVRQKIMFVPIVVLLFTLLKGQKSNVYAMETKAASQCLTHLSEELHLALGESNILIKKAGKKGGAWLIRSSFVAGAIGVVGTVGVIAGMGEPSIELSLENTEYINRPVSVFVEIPNVQKGSTLQWEYEGKVIPVDMYAAEKGYKVYLEKNGKYKVIVTTPQGDVLERPIEISHIDRREPEIISNVYDERTKCATIQVADDISGVDLEKTTIYDKDGNVWTDWEADGNTIQINGVEDKMRLHVFDFAKNSSIYEIVFEKNMNLWQEFPSY